MKRATLKYESSENETKLEIKGNMLEVAGSVAMLIHTLRRQMDDADFSRLLEDAVTMALKMPLDMEDAKKFMQDDLDKSRVKKAA